jgi:hypothetical protein
MLISKCYFRLFRLAAAFASFCFTRSLTLRSIKAYIGIYSGRRQDGGLITEVVE